MLLGKTISLVLPCYNEEESLRVLLPAVPSCVDEVLVVDNASTDGSIRAARELGARVIFEGRRGYGFAIRRGLEEAAKDIVVVMDADTTYPLGEILRLSELLIRERWDFISGSRFPLVRLQAMPFSHRVGNRIVTAFVNLLFGLKLEDSQSGMWVLRKEILSQMSLTAGGMPFSTEIKLEAFGRAKLRARECQIPFGRERVGVSKLSPVLDPLFILIFLLKKRLERNRLGENSRGPFGAALFYLFPVRLKIAMEMRSVARIRIPRRSALMSFRGFLAAPSPAWVS